VLLGAVIDAHGTPVIAQARLIEIGTYIALG